MTRLHSTCSAFLSRAGFFILSVSYCFLKSFLWTVSAESLTTEHLEIRIEGGHIVDKTNINDQHLQIHQGPTTIQLGYRFEGNELALKLELRTVGEPTLLKPIREE